MEPGGRRFRRTPKRRRFFIPGHGSLGNLVQKGAYVFFQNFPQGASASQPNIPPARTEKVTQNAISRSRICRPWAKPVRSTVARSHSSPASRSCANFSRRSRTAARRRSSSALESPSSTGGGVGASRSGEPLAKAERDAMGATNIYRDTATLLVTPWLA
ncbi:MAG: hypothetical protein FD149_1941 [Rhodospirillaceae bacterium]|nr:MAG: hypothetical protein FD149_1941 [Rhodospirillaceae bacterium]